MPTGSSLVGTKLGVYEVESLIGRGGMSVVYRGYNPNLARPVAIKVLSGAVAGQDGFAERFRREARLLARLHHPRIVQIYDAGEHDGALYMVQELLPGPTLEARLAERAPHGGHLPDSEVLSIVRDVAAALDAAHAAGVIHRDIKPSNMVYDAAGAVVLTDFGIAEDAHVDERYTRTGVILGTPTYLSPEQAQALPLTPAADIYALGVVLYELFAGQPPFVGARPLGVALSHVHSPPPPLRLQRPDLSPAVELVVRRALAKAPAERFPSAGALADALERALGVGHAGLVYATQPLRQPGRARIRYATVGLALLLAGGGLAWRGRAGQPAILPAQSAAMPTPGVLQAADPFRLPATVLPSAQPAAPPAPRPAAPALAPGTTRPPAPASQASVALPAPPAQTAGGAKAAPPPAPKPDKPKAAPQPRPKGDKPKGKDKPAGDANGHKGGGKKGK